MTQPIPGSLAWMTYTMASVRPVQTLDRYGGILINQYSDETGYNPYTTEDLTADYTIENPVFDLMRWI